MRVREFFKAVSIDTNLLVALRATNLLLPPTPSRDHMLNHSMVHPLRIKYTGYIP